LALVIITNRTRTKGTMAIKGIMVGSSLVKATHSKGISRATSNRVTPSRAISSSKGIPSRAIRQVVALL